MEINEIRAEIATKRVYKLQLLSVAERIMQLRKYENLQKIEELELNLLVQVQDSLLVDYNNFRYENGLPPLEGIN